MFNIEINSDNIVSFISGDILTTIVLQVGFPELNWLHPIIHTASILFLGAVGGFGGLLGQRVFKFLEKKYDNR